MLAPHPEAAGRFDAIWIAGGRVVDWGPAHPVGVAGADRGGRESAAEGARPIDAADLAARSARAFRAAPAPGKLGGWLPADAVAEARLVGLWVAANRPPTLELGARTGEAAHTAFLARAGTPMGTWP